jgi:predicted nucleic acid-binding protein
MKKNNEDLLHIAYAATYKCGFLISWNRKHLAKETTQAKLNAYNKYIRNASNFVQIITPETFLEKEN